MQPPLVSQQPDAPATYECDGDAQPVLESLKQLGIMKFTAMYVARYGMHFCRDLMKNVVMKPQFEFMEPSSSKFSLYNVVVDAYSRILEPCYVACTETILKEFFRSLQLEKLEGEAIIDLHAFVSGVDYFANVEDVDYSALMPPPELLSVIMNRIPSMRRLLSLCNSSVCIHPHRTGPFTWPSPIPEAKRPKFDPSMEPEAKRQKFDESALVTE